MAVPTPTARTVSAEPATCVRIGYGALALTVAPMIYLHLAGSRIVDPVRATVSDYVSVPGGAVLLAISALSLAIATAVLALGLVRTGLRRPGPVGVLFGLGVVGLVASVAFPTNALGSAVSESAVLHRYAAGLFFISLPIAGWLAHRRGVRGVGAMSIVSALAGIVFLISHIPLVFPDLPAGDVISAVLPRGLAERGLLLVDIALLACVGRALGIVAGTAVGRAHR